MEGGAQVDMRVAGGAAYAGKRRARAADHRYFVAGSASDPTSAGSPPSAVDAGSRAMARVVYRSLY